MAVAQLTATRLPSIVGACQPGNCRNGSKKIANNTYAHYRHDGVEVTHHSNRIMFMPFPEGPFDPDEAMNRHVLYEIGNAGWHTMTTAGRLHQITRANGGGMVGIKDGIMRYTAPDGTVYDMYNTLVIDSVTGEVVLD